MINNIDIKKMGAYVFVKLFLRKTCIQTLKPKCFLIIEEWFHFQGFNVIAFEST